VDSRGDADSPRLRATLSLPALAIYAVGDILGAGIYALVGKVAGVCGPALWLAFLVAAFVAFLTGLSYAEFSVRHPRSAGAALYCREGLRHPLPAFVVGIFVLMSGLTSAATVSRALVGYLDQFVAVPELAASVGFLLLVSVLSFWGIEESSRVNIVLTAIEVGGLLLVIVAGATVARGLSTSVMAERLAIAPAELAAVAPAVTIAFFAFIGFEDLANVAEEARDPRYSLPRAIVIGIGFSSVVYMLVGLAALVAVPPTTLAASTAPLALVVDASGIRVPSWLFAAIGLVAIANTGLLNLIMAARLSYGMAREGLLPAVLARVHPRRHTPTAAVVLVFVLAAVLALSGGVRVLAQSTSFLLLIAFLAVHVSLLAVKWRESPTAADGFRVPWVVPAAGVMSCGWLATHYPLDVYVRAALVAVAALALYGIAGGAARNPDRAPTAGA
jgi:amino acid transporter